MKDVWIPLSGAVAQQSNLDVIANNVANVNTPGFKKDQMVFKEYLTVHNKNMDDLDLPTREWKPADFYRSDGAEKGYVKSDGIYTNYQPGQLTPTGNPLDLGIVGNGFFEIQTPLGLRYTRNGQFSLSKEGDLVTLQGFKVLSKKEPTSNTPSPQADGEKKETSKIEDRYINIGLAGKGRLSINDEGEVAIGGKVVAPLSVVEFKDLHALRKEGSANFINSEDGNLVRENVRSRVVQGSIENSNVDAIIEMSSLIKANRHFESIQRAIKAYDTISGRGVNEIGKF